MLGAEVDETVPPETLVVEQTRPEQETAAETATKEEQAKPKPKPKPDETPNKDPPKGALPPVPVASGDPFGDPGGWSDLAKDGDPWATAIKRALDDMPVGAAYAKVDAGNFKFQLTLCKDGSVEHVAKKGGSLPADVQDAVRLALERLELPKPPPHVARQMKGRCAKIEYTFVWSARGVQ
jgi:hypothetical protein